MAGEFKIESAKVPIQEILEVAKWYPSGDNSQPFRFRWQEEVLSVLHDDKVADHELNFSNRTSFISLGMLITNLKYAAKAHGFETQVVEISSSSPSACIRFIKGSAVDDKMSQLIKQRHTHRGAFTKGDPKIINQVVDASPCFAGCKIEFKVPDKDEVKKIARLECFLAKWPAALLRVIGWIRFGDPKQALTGLYWKNLGVTYVDSLFLRLIQRLPWIFHLLIPGIQLNYYFTAIKNISSGNGMICIHAPSFSAESLIGLGQTAMEFWLRITEFGFKMQPLTLSSLLVSEIKANVGSPKVPLAFKKSVERLALESNGSGVVYWSFRIGLAEDLPRDALTRRLPNSAILEG